MKTKILLLMIISLLLTVKANSQEMLKETPIAFKVTKFYDKTNGINFDSIAKNADVRLVFSENEEGDFLFTNWWKNEKSASTGPISSFEFLFYSKNPYDERFEFIWHYANSYDNETGSAKVEFSLKKLDEMITFECTIKPQNNNEMDRNEVLQLAGYMIPSSIDLIK